MPRWKEQYGRVIAEAMSCGIPVIGSDSGSIPAMIGADGLLFPEGNVQALANQLRELIDNPDLRAELARRGLERAKSHYSIEVQAREMSIAYRQLTAISNPQVSPS
jgi:glycosyltransferase involved in cell wall biosynthesis